MRETRFIEKNKLKWNEFEVLLRSDSIHPDDLQRMYVQITDDLSFARTFYPNRSVRVYLNYLAQRILAHLNKTKKSPAQSFINFWKNDLPLIVWEARWEFMLSLGIFLLAVAIGVVSTMIDADFPRQILGDDYVNMTLENIRKGDPMAVYKGGSSLGSTLGITANNIFVSLKVFVSGILAGIGSIVIMLQTGIMVGSFQYFFISRGLGLDSILAIWLHGTFEISAIVIAGGAGLTMGKGLLFPGTYRRLQSFQRSARRGFEIMTGTIPLFLVAGFVEGTFTRYTSAPTIVRASFIVLCAAIIIFYFIYYPYQLSKKNIKNPLKDSIIPPDNLDPIVFSKIRTVGDVLSDTFFILRKKGNILFGISLAFTFIYLAFFFYLADESPAKLFTDSVGSVYLMQFFCNSKVPFLWLIVPFLLSLFAALVGIIMKKTENENKSFPIKDFVGMVISLLPSLLLFYGIMQIEKGAAIFLILLLLLGFLMIWQWDSIERKNPFTGLGEVFQMTFNKFAYTLGVLLFLFFIGLALNLLFDTILIGFLWSFISTNLHLNSAGYNDAEAVFKSIFSIFTFFATYTMLLAGSGITFHSIMEIIYGEKLLERINTIQLKRNVRGMELE
jgi:uncharacterized membrane protein SpoIIM required for sporulation